MKVTVDIVIFTIQSGAFKVLLVKRAIPPFKGRSPFQAVLFTKARVWMRPPCENCERKPVLPTSTWSNCTRLGTPDETRATA